MIMTAAASAVLLTSAYSWSAGEAHTQTHAHKDSTAQEYAQSIHTQVYKCNYTTNSKNVFLYRTDSSNNNLFPYQLKSKNF